MECSSWVNTQVSESSTAFVTHTVAALSALARENMIDVGVVKQAISQFDIDPEKPDPVTL